MLLAQYEGFDDEQTAGWTQFQMIKKAKHDVLTENDQGYFTVIHNICPFFSDVKSAEEPRASSST